MGRCKRGCCWNPYGICARKHECHCHNNKHEEENPWNR